MNATKGVTNIADLIPADRLARGLWWSRAWSLVEGCTPVSPGCDHCWSASACHMRAKHPNDKIRAANEGLTDVGGQFNGMVRYRADRINLPLMTKKPQVWAVWNDLFHEGITDEQIAAAFGIMAVCPQHVFIVLTKRPKRMREWFQWVQMFAWARLFYKCRRDPAAIDANCVLQYASGPHDECNPCPTCKGICRIFGNMEPSLWPLENVILMTTVENQATAKERIIELLLCPAACRGLSNEPALGPLEIYEFLQDHAIDDNVPPRLDWVIAGGESGPGSRPAHPDWFRKIRDDCEAAGVAFTFKQWGDLMHTGNPDMPDDTWVAIDAANNVTNGGGGVHRVGKKKAGRMLDGRTWDGFPDLRLEGGPAGGRQGRG